MKETLSQKLYSGKVSLEFYPDGHTYWVNGKRVTSVTSLIGILDKSQALIPWAVGEFANYLREYVGQSLTNEHIFNGAQQHKIKKEKAASIGDDVHTWIEKFVKGEKPQMPERVEAQIGVNAFLKWIDENKVKFISSERVIYSRKHDYIGKLDIEAKVNGELCLVDIKTSNGIYNSYNLQTAAYVKADEEESKKKYDGRWIIRLAKETEVEYLKRMTDKGKTEVAAYVPLEAKFLDNEKGNMKRDFDAFLACMELYSWNKETNPYTTTGL